MKIKNIAIVAMSVFALAACDRVPAGHVGVKVYQLGSNKGVDTEVLGVGRYWIGINEELFLFPTYTQNYVWTKEMSKGSPNDESITFQTVEGLSVNADFGIQYTLNPEKISDIFQKYRKGINEITDVFLRNEVRNALNEIASDKSVEAIYGAGKAEFLREVNDRVSSRVKPNGINIETIYVVGDFRLPPQVVASINAKIEATQRAQQRANEVAQSRAEADKKIEEARGVAESILVEAKAQEEANRLISKSLTPELIQYLATQKWNGILPQVTSGAMPLINIENQKK